MQENEKAPLDQQLTYFTKQLFECLNHQQVKLLIKALKKNAADSDDDTKPAPKTNYFVEKQNSKKLCWIANQSHFWDIKHVYEAAVNQMAYRITKGKNIPLHALNNAICHDVTQHIDCTDLKLAIGTRLQQIVRPIRKWSITCPRTTFSADGTRILFAYEFGNPPVYIYDVASKKIIGELTPPEYEEVKDARYAHNDTRILIKTSQKKYPLGNVFVYDSKNLQLIRKIPLADCFNNLIVHNDQIVIHDKRQVTIYTDHDTFHIDNPEQDAHIAYMWRSPDGSQLCMQIGKCPGYKLYFYNMSDKKLLTIIDYQQWITPIYTSDNSKLFVITDNRMLLYDAKALDKQPQEIVSFSEEKSRYQALSQDNTQLALVTSDALLVYDIQTNTIKRAKLPYNITLYNNYFIYYSSNSSQLLLGTTDHYMLQGRNDGIFTCNTKEDTIQLKHLLHPKDIRNFNYYTPDCSRILCWSAPNEDLHIYDAKTGNPAFCTPLAKHCVKVEYSPDKTHMALSSSQHGFTIRPTLSDSVFNQDIRSLQLMIKALDDWHYRKQPYAITTSEEKEVYDSLDPALQDEQLFTLAVK